jgi:Protein of unknown function (DUF1493)
MAQTAERAEALTCRSGKGWPASHRWVGPLLQPTVIMMPTFDEIAAFVCEEAGVRRSHLTEATSRQGDIGLYGDDIDHLMLEYSKRFGVNLGGYIWYFHTGGDGCSISALFFRPPNMRVAHIPITIGMLHEFAQVGRSNIQYPDHSVPHWRLDILINQIVVIRFLICLLCAAIGAAIRGCE